MEDEGIYIKHLQTEKENNINSVNSPRKIKVLVKLSRCLQTKAITVRNAILTPSFILYSIFFNTYQKVAVKIEFINMFFLIYYFAALSIKQNKD